MAQEAASLVLQVSGCDVYRADYRQLAAIAARRDDGTVADLTFADTPYSEKTHKGHNAGVINASDVEGYAAGKKGPYRRNKPSRKRERRYANNRAKAGLPRRREINYAFWTPDDVMEYVETWSPLTRGWMIGMCDDVLQDAWLKAYRAVGRYEFAPIPFIWSGSSNRMTGDGPPNWTRYVMVARPKTVEFARWGVPDGGGMYVEEGLPPWYILPGGQAEKMRVVGGKPLWLMDALVRDYSNPGNLVCDPFCGAGTTGVAALRGGRPALLGELLAEHAAIAAEEVASPRARAVTMLEMSRRLRWKDPPTVQGLLAGLDPVEPSKEESEQEEASR